MIVEQCSDLINKFWFRRILISWSLCCVILGNTYKTKITSLIITGPTIPAKSIADLADEGYKLLFSNVRIIHSLFSI